MTIKVRSMLEGIPTPPQCKKTEFLVNMSFEELESHVEGWETEQLIRALYSALDVITDIGKEKLEVVEVKN